MGDGLGCFRPNRRVEWRDADRVIPSRRICSCASIETDWNESVPVGLALLT